MAKGAIVKVLLVILLSLVILPTSAPKPVQAESGCSFYTVSEDRDVYGYQYGYGVYDCGNDGANANRQLQVCLQRDGRNIICSLRTGLSYTLFRINVANYNCHWTADVWRYRTWAWFRGEDGSTVTTIDSGILSGLYCG